MKNNICHKICTAAVSACLACTAILPLFPETTLNALATTYDYFGYFGDLEWSIDGSTLTISGTGSIEDSDEYPWAGRDIVFLQIEEGVTSIGNAAFSGISSLRSISLPSTLTEIHEYAFDGTSIEDLTLPENISILGEGAFQNCYKLKNVDIQCQLTEIPAHLFDINDETILQSQTIFTKTKMQISLPDSVTSIGGYAFANHSLSCTEDGEFPLPEQLETVGPYAFAKSCSSFKIMLPDSVSVIYGSSFYYAETLTLGAGVTEILPSDDGATLIDSSIDQIYVSPENLVFSSSDDGIALYNHDKTVLYAVLSRRALENDTFTIPKTVTTLANPIYSINIHNFAVEEGNPVFAAVDGILTSSDGKTLVQYPEGRNNIRGEVTVVIPDTFTVIGKGAFSHTSATYAVLPDTVEEIGDDAFAFSSLTSIVQIGSALRRIGERAFYQTQLSGFRIHASVTEIGSQAFGGDSFVSLVFDHPAGAEILSFAADLSDCSVYYAYAGSPVEQLFPEKFVLRENIGGSSCGEDLQWSILGGELYIKGSGTMTDSGSFPWSDQNFTSVIFSGTDIEIAPKAFSGMKNLYTVDLSGVISIGSTAFSGCSQLRSVTRSDSVKMVGAGAFNDTAWKGNAAYYDAEDKGYASVGTVLLWVNPTAETITIPETISYVSEQAFTKGIVHTLYLPETPVVFHNNAFYNNTVLEHVRRTGSETDIPASEYRKEAENIHEIEIYDENGQLTKAFGFSMENTLLSLANAAYLSPYLKTLTDSCYAEILQESGCTEGDSDQQLTEAVYREITGRTTYGFVYGEDICGETVGTDNTWSLNQHTAYNVVGPLLTGYGVCAAYTNCMTDMIMLLQEKGFTETLQTQRMGSDEHVWNAVGLDTGTREEAWYYVDAANGLCLIGYENQVLKDYADMFSYNADLQKNENGTYTVYSSTGAEILLQGSDRSTFMTTDASYGDTNCDGRIDLADAIILNKFVADVVHLSDTAVMNADCDANGDIDTNDAIVLLQFLVHLVGVLPYTE